jgi:hypothetical protein
VTQWRVIASARRCPRTETAQLWARIWSFAGIRAEIVPRVGASTRKILDTLLDPGPGQSWIKIIDNVGMESVQALSLHRVRGQAHGV